MGKLKAKELKEKLGVKEKHVEALIRTLRKTSWALYQTEKEFETTKQKGVFRVHKCRTQETRIKKGLGVFPYKRVRLNYLRSFAAEFNLKN